MPTDTWNPCRPLQAKIHADHQMEIHADQQIEILADQQMKIHADHRMEIHADHRMNIQRIRNGYFMLKKSKTASFFLCTQCHTLRVCLPCQYEA